MKIYNNNTNKDKTKQNNCFNIIRSYITHVINVTSSFTIGVLPSTFTFVFNNRLMH